LLFRHSGPKFSGAELNVLVLGATGFIGRHLVSALLERNHSVTAVGRNREHSFAMPWIERVRFVEADMYDEAMDVRKIADDSDVVVDLIWPGLPNYTQLFHFERNLVASYRMLKSFVVAGHQHVLVAGTCLEYGLQEGRMIATNETHPQLSYAFAKDSLRKSLEMLRAEMPFCLQWARIFYTYGEGQNPNSLLPQLDAAIDRGDGFFKMSGGEQLRDFLSVESASLQLARLLEQPTLQGPFNICSGRPTSVRSLVENRLQRANSSLRLQLGHFPYPPYEPMAFWGESHPELLAHETESGYNE
jgi:nucleoside-diphosphate-sugar epimerase